MEFGKSTPAVAEPAMVPCNPALLAQTPPLPLRTLDAIHLASARVSGEMEIVATDKRLRDAAKLLGFSLFPV